MISCKKCGATLDNNMLFCPVCGERIMTENQNFTGTVDQDGGSYEFCQDDINKNKGMCILAYLSWLVLIPVFAGGNSKVTRFHANQGLVLAIAELAWWIISGIVDTILWALFGYSVLRGIYILIKVVLSLVNIVFLILSIIGIINVANGETKELPLIGKIKILK